MSESVARQTLDTPFDAQLEIHADRHGVSAIFFRLDPGARPADRPNYLTQAAALQLREYFDGQRRAFTLPLSPLAAGGPATPYRRTVWHALLEIPYGQTRTYSDIARKTGGSARSVGTANGRNPLCVVVPCHRVVRKDGLGGYGGPLVREKGARFLDLKRQLLAHERRHA